MKPTITFALFNYCQARFLPESLHALSSQRDPPDEILIFDDCSTDNSIEILEKVPGAKFQFNKKNVGLFANIEKALEMATGDFIIFSAADDLIHPDFIYEYRKIINERPDLGLICSDCVIFDDGKPPYSFGQYRFLPVKFPLVFSDHEVVDIYRKTEFMVMSFTAIYNKKIVKKYGGYNTELKSLADFYLNLKISLNHPIGYIPKPLGAVRIVSNSYGDRFRKNLKERMLIFDTLLKLVHEEKEIKFRKAFKKSKVLSFGGIFIFYYLFQRPKYLPYLFSIIFKNWKASLWKISCLLRGIPVPVLPIKPSFEMWP